MKTLGYLIAVLLLLTPWIINFNKLTHCDFKPDYKCEVIHAAGLVPILSFVTVWHGDDQ